MSSILIEHLKSRPIAPIYDALNEKYHLTVLKMLCVIDYHIDISGMYAEIDKMPKLLSQLLTSKNSFASFKYYSYKLPTNVKIENKLLKCKHCELLAPYSTTLEHMAFCHDFHVNVNICVWCEKCDYHQHSLEECYEAYMAKHQFSSTFYPPVIPQFYRMLKRVAKKLRVNITHSQYFKNASNKHLETIPLDEDDDSMSRDIIVFTAKRTSRVLDANELETKFQKAMQYFHINFCHFNDGNINAIPSASRFKNTGNNNASMWNVFGPSSTTNGSTRNFGTDEVTFETNQPSTSFESANSTSQFNVPHSSTSNFYSMTPSPQPQSPIFSEVPSGEQNFSHFIGSVLHNIRDQALRKRAKLEIQSIAFKYCAEDANKQLTEETYFY
ncbi:uncharacterized protein LOC116344248 [Contarinia nasturtii]|uniref:uncharacterized protein LOC116344248 n=1 Tax=Contarinia nasturtii TaxID=265458 RepID=UPI0012D478BB|nr:uncharacterized protein LOC116344248 [Contarinia nasturtii]